MRARPTRTSLCLLSQQLCADVWLLLWRSMSEPQRRSVRIKTHQGSCTADVFWAFSIILAFSVSRYRLDHAAAVVLSPPAPASQGSITRTSWSVWETRVPCSLVKVNSPSLLPHTGFYGSKKLHLTKVAVLAFPVIFHRQELGIMLECLRNKWSSRPEDCRSPVCFGKQYV